MGEELPEGYTEILCEKELGLLKSSRLMEELVKMNLEHPRLSIKLKTGELVVYVLERQAPKSGVGNSIMPKTLKDIPLKYLAEKQEEMYPISLKILIEIAKRQSEEPGAVEEIAQIVNERVGELEGSPNTEVGKLAEALKEVSGI